MVRCTERTRTSKKSPQVMHTKISVPEAHVMPGSIKETKGWRGRSLQFFRIVIDSAWLVGYLLAADKLVIEEEEHPLLALGLRVGDFG